MAWHLVAQNCGARDLTVIDRSCVVVDVLGANTSTDILSLRRRRQDRLVCTTAGRPRGETVDQTTRGLHSSWHARLFLVYASGVGTFVSRADPSSSACCYQQSPGRLDANEHVFSQTAHTPTDRQTDTKTCVVQHPGIAVSSAWSRN